MCDYYSPPGVTHGCSCCPARRDYAPAACFQRRTHEKTASIGALCSLCWIVVMVSRSWRSPARLGRPRRGRGPGDGLHLFRDVCVGFCSGELRRRGRWLLLPGSLRRGRGRRRGVAPRRRAPAADVGLRLAPQEVA
ncbi:unnamed protein product [Pelagomonas calceolata]|uniref:Uncharacterized protein n=2 Tax=Pelagomonas calceolata TaxID=35677 RepID=A0A8J2SFR5_9STRA|nr:unnamed protein product [Pelagomonas calceolata]